ncbi:MAG: carbamoyltransferase HypF, partial [Bacteroidota bacterium]
MGTYHIHIKGRVQGVGFRPFIYQIAREFQLKGWVCNATDGVHIRFSAHEEVANRFLQICISNKPRLAVVTDSYIKRISPEKHDDFQIIESQSSSLEIDISPDFNLCKSCRSELTDPKNIRHNYPFITCTHCGPRYSILKGLPYDRPYTSMDKYQMCDSCLKEYTDPLDRRYFSQTNSCKTCGVQLALIDPQNGKLNLCQGEVFNFINEALKEDKIIAVKGIGGFLLLCNASSNNAILTLRQRKNRPSKPFAVLYPDLDAVECQFHVHDKEKEMLDGPISPIVLLQKKENSAPLSEFIAPHLKSIGVMIPYAPLLQIISSNFNSPLIATSANLSGVPIIHGDDLSRLDTLADLILEHDRPITFPQDDSVVQFSPSNKHSIVLRRSRGMAPSVLNSIKNSGPDRLALGAEMKASFGLHVNSNTYISQYLGNLSHYENQVQFESVLKGLRDLIRPDLKEIIIDMHPGYFTHQLGKELASNENISLTEVQHHEAHFMSVLSEKNLLKSRVLGVIWDGTGFGSDGNTWGGEFFDYEGQSIQRIAHFNYFTNLANDRMSTDNRLCALSLSGDNYDKLERYFKPVEWEFYCKSIKEKKTMTSSMGRIFDAVAFNASLADKNTYEGQSAMLLEQDARNSDFDLSQL